MSLGGINLVKEESEGSRTSCKDGRFLGGTFAKAFLENSKNGWRISRATDGKVSGNGTELRQGR
jgi:hypothetical protein